MVDVYDAASEAINMNPIFRDHSYASHASPPELMLRKSQRSRFPVHRFKFAKRSYCVVCRKILKDIGVELNDSVCSLECLKKHEKST